MEENLNPTQPGVPQSHLQAAPSSATPTSTSAVSKCDFRQSGQLGAEQVRQLSALHQTFAAGLANALSAYLRAGIEVKLLGVEQIPYREFVSRLPEQPYVVSVSMLPAEESAAIQLDLRLLLPIIDLLLGGSGRETAEVRQLTEIEEQVLDALLTVICRELQAAWQPVLPIQFQAEKRLKQSHILKLIESEDRTLYLNFEMVLNDIRGLLTLVFSSAPTIQLLRQLGQQGSSPRRSTHRATNGHMRDRLLDCKFTAELRIPRLALRIREIVDLQPGQILPLRHPVNEALSFSINGFGLFAGVPVSCGGSRGALLQEKAPEKFKEQ
jgi:flagellar motor switch protein FliM